MSRFYKVTPFAILPIIFIIAFIVVLQIGNSSQSATPINSTKTEITQPNPAQVTTSPSTQNTSSTYKNGTFSAKVSYEVPEENTNSISVQVTIANDVISQVSYTNNPTERTSERYGKRFDEAFSDSQLVSKSVTKAELTRLGGASLTTGAFNDALQKAIAQGLL
jgi:uncharacterized protein with FMN-binding domain